MPAWAAEAQVFIAWRDAVWLYSYAELAKATAGEREVPTVEAFIGELPAIESLTLGAALDSSDDLVGIGGGNNGGRLGQN